MNIYSKNEGLFWLIGISLTLILFVFSLFSNIVNEYDTDNIWDIEFLNKQYYLNQLNNSNKPKKDFIKKLLKLDNRTDWPIKNFSKQNDTLTNRTIIILDNTKSIQNNNDKIFGLDRKNIENDFAKNCPNNTIIEIKKFYKKPNTLLGISCINSFINNRSKEDELLFIVYNGNDKIEQIKTNEYENKIFIKNNKFIEDGFYNSYLQKLDSLINIKTSTQKTSFVKIFKYLSNKVTDSNFNYDIIIISDFNDDFDNTNDFKRNVTGILNKISANNVKNIFNLELTSKSRRKNEKYNFLKNKLSKKFHFQNYVQINIKKLSDFTNKPFSHIVREIQSNFKMNTIFPVYYSYKMNNKGDFAFGYLPFDSPYRYNVVFEDNNYNDYNYYLENIFISDELIPFDKESHKMQGIFINLKNLNKNLFLQTYDNDKLISKKPIKFKRILNASILRILAFSIMIFIISIIALAVRIIPLFRFYWRALSIIGGIIFFIFMYMIYFTKVEAMKCSSIFIFIVIFIYSMFKNIFEYENKQ